MVMEKGDGVQALLVINATLDPVRERQIAAGLYPRKDYLELRDALGVDILDLTALDQRRWMRLVRRVAGAAVAQALLAWRLAPCYDAIFADHETTGFVIAALSRLRPVQGRRPRLTMIGHLLSPPGKQALVRGLRLDRVIDALVVHSTLQGRLAERTLGFQSNQVALVPYQTDERFWSPREQEQEGDGDGDAPARICSVGLEYRDYETLVEAVRGLPVELVIAAASHWSTHQGLASERPTPPNVRVASFDYAALRDLYAASLFVVVPLHDVENQAGITTILEAMAMGKAVVVSHTRGQTDVVRDRRRASRADASRPTQPDWARDLGAPEETARAHTGIYVRPGDPDELRRAITFLLVHPDQARAMGANGRRLVEQTMGLDHFTARMAVIIRGDATAAQG